MELAELEATKIDFETQMRLMDEDPAFKEDEEEEATVQNRCYQATEESFSSNQEEVMEMYEEFDLGQTRESPQEDYYDSPTPDWMNLYEEESLSQEEPEETEAKLRAKKGKAPMMEEEPKPKKKEILLGAFRNPLLYFSHKKGPTQRKWEGKVPPWLRQGANDKLKAAAAGEDEGDDEDEESGGSEEAKRSEGSDD